MEDQNTGGTRAQALSRKSSLPSPRRPLRRHFRDASDVPSAKYASVPFSCALDCGSFHTMNRNEQQGQPLRRTAALLRSLLLLAA